MAKDLLARKTPKYWLQFWGLIIGLFFKRTVYGARFGVYGARFTVYGSGFFLIWPAVAVADAKLVR
jgi:hypothetical protein